MTKRLTSTLEDKARELIAYTLGVTPDKVTDSAKFVEDLGMDSLRKIDLVISFEEEFDIEISAKDIKKLITVEDAINYILANI